jgi:hypothetical protein
MQEDVLFWIQFRIKNTGSIITSIILQRSDTTLTKLGDYRQQRQVWAINK